MERRMIESLGLAMILMVSIITGCQQVEPAPAVAPTTETAPSATTAPAEPTTAPEQEASSVSLEIVGSEGSQTLSLENLKALPVTEGFGVMKDSTGKIYPPVGCKGVSLQELASQAGELGPDKGVSVVAKDGYAMTFSYRQVSEGDFVAYDPGTGDEKTAEGPLTAILAYEMEGEPIPDTEGPLRVMIVGADPNQATDGHWWVKWVTNIELKTVAQDWNLYLEGAITEDMDRATFESGSAPRCHGLTWTDDEGMAWTGIPLWLLVGRVDDDNKHEGEAFNDELAERGYTVDVIAADGYSTTFESTAIQEDDDIIVAYLVDDQPLGDKNFPLRLVGPELTKGQMVGQIERIAVNLPPEAAVTITGSVEEALYLDVAGLQEAAEAVEVEHPKKGMQPYEGVSLNQLLSQAGAYPDATTVVMTAGDGYSGGLDLADLIACEGCILEIDGEQVNAVMGGMPTNLWIKDVVTIEVIGGAPREEAAEEEEPAEESEPESELPAPTGEVVLTISGQVENELRLDVAGLEAIAVDAEVEHPKKGPQTYRGAPLCDVLDQAGIQSGATKIALIGSDGYRSEVSLADVRACDVCLLSIEDGVVSTAMSGMEGSTWVKDVTSIEVQ